MKVLKILITQGIKSFIGVIAIFIAEKFISFGFLQAYRENQTLQKAQPICFALYYDSFFGFV